MSSKSVYPAVLVVYTEKYVQVFSIIFQYEKYDELFGHNFSTARSSKRLVEYWLEIDKNERKGKKTIDTK